MNNNVQTINISTSTIFRIILILLSLIFLYLIRDILLIVFVSVIIAAAINGPVSWLQNRRVPRLLGVVFIYLLLFLLFALVITLIFPSLAEQIKQLTTILPDFTEKLGVGFEEIRERFGVEGNLESILRRVSQGLSQATSNVFGTIVNVFGGLFSAVVVLVISFYLAVQERGVKRFLVSLTPNEHQRYVADLIERIQKKIGGWLRGQLLLMAIVGFLIFLGLYFLGIKYALTLALLAGLLEIIPYIGPVFAAIPAIILAFFQSPFLALLVIILFIVVQQLENYLIVPQVMRKAVGLSPIIVIVTMLIGAKLAGILGIILAVPLTAAIAEVFKDIQEARS